MRRLLAAVVLGGLALAGVVLPAAAQSSYVTIDPFSTRCVAPGTRTTIPVSGTTSHSQVDIELFSPAGARLFATRIFADGGYSGSFAFAGHTATGEYEVRVTTVPASASASVYLEVPCQAPTLEFNPPCFTPGAAVGRVTFTARHFVPNQPFHSMTYDYQGPEQQSNSPNAPITANNRGVFSHTFSIKPPANRAYPGRASDSDGVLVARADWLPCPPPTTSPPTTDPPDDTTTTEQSTIPPTVVVTLPPTRGTTTTSTSTTIPPVTPGATLIAMPAVGPPGFVVLASGTGFPTGSVELTWAPGIGKTVAIVGPDGKFTVQMLVFPKDRLGPRSLVATGGGVTATANFLVVPPTVQPSSGSDVTRINLTRRLNNR